MKSPRTDICTAARITNNAKDAKDVEYRYQYDDIGNRISSHDLGTNRTYSANNLNQYTHSYTTCRDTPRARCESFARIYYNAVVRLGGNPYKNAQSKNGCCGDADNGND